MGTSESQETLNGPQSARGESEPDAHLLEDLRQQHRRLDEQIAEMEARVALTPEEHLRAATLKKRKLALRDRIQLVSSRL